MLALGWLLASIAGLLILLVLPATVWFEVRRAYAGKRNVVCPENKELTEVDLDAELAARSRFGGPAVAKIAHCSRWPMREGCAEGCIPDAVAQNRPDLFSINHVGVLVAGLASTAVGDLLRCSPFAREWMAAAGYPAVDFWHSIAFRAPAIFDLAAMILLAYVITWLMRHLKFAGVLGGLEVGALVWLAVICLSIPEIIFFYPVKIFAMNCLLKLASLLTQGILIGLFVAPQPRVEAVKA